MTPPAIGLQWVAVKVYGAYWVPDGQRALIIVGVLLAVRLAILFVWALARRHRRRTEIAHVLWPVSCIATLRGTPARWRLPWAVPSGPVKRRTGRLLLCQATAMVRNPSGTYLSLPRSRSGMRRASSMAVITGWR
jgi:hypothetical protein